MGGTAIQGKSAKTSPLRRKFNTFLIFLLRLRRAKAFSAVLQLKSDLAIVGNNMLYWNRIHGCNATKKLTAERIFT